MSFVPGGGDAIARSWLGDREAAVSSDPGAADALAAEPTAGEAADPVGHEPEANQEPAVERAAAAHDEPAGNDAAAASGEPADSHMTAGQETPLPDDVLSGAIEAILLVVDEPVSSTVLAQVISAPADRVERMLAGLRRDYDEAGRGFELREVGEGWRLYTHPKFASYVERFVLDGQQARLTQAALETLAVVAYRQPVSRSRVSAVRGVNVDGVMRTLMSRGLVEEAGAEHESGAILYRTTPYFLERLGLRDLDQLPSLANFLPESTTIDQLEDELSGEGRDG